LGPRRMVPNGSAWGQVSYRKCGQNGTDGRFWPPKMGLIKITGYPYLLSTSGSVLGRSNWVAEELFQTAVLGSDLMARHDARKPQRLQAFLRNY
jgi:hypothetical protein